MKRSYLFFLLMLTGTIHIYSQISITQQDVENILEAGTSWINYSNSEVNGSSSMDIGITSNSVTQNWQEPLVTYTDTLVSINLPPSATGYQSYFPAATHSQRITMTMDGYTSDHYSFLQVTADEVRDLGFLQHVYGNGIDTIFALEQYSDLTFKLPLLINSSFETYYDSSDGGFGIYNVEQVIKTCDAFGNITFFGNTDQALRITSSTAHRVYQDGNLINFWYQREYEWLTKSIGFFDIDVDTSSILSGNVPIQEIDVTVFSGATGINNQNEPINTFTLEQNYPNPFNPSTVISYQLPVSGFVSLKVYDVLGNEVATLVNGEQNSGSHSINFNAAQLSSGVYIYRLNAGKFSETKSMILIR